MFAKKQFVIVLIGVTLLPAGLGCVAGAKEKVILDTDMVMLYDDGVAMSHGDTPA